MVEEVLGENQHNLVLRFNPWLFSGAADLVGHFFRDLAGQLHEKRDKRLQALGNALDEYGRFLAPLTGISDTGPLGKAVKRWGRALPESVESQRKLLTQMLLQFDRQVVVLIDDIDRLAPDEVRDVMRLVRLVGDLPRTRYLLAFDRARVAKALSDEYEDGQAYIEKIVQVAFEVPEPLWVNLTAALVDVVHPYFESRYLSASEGDKRNILGAVIRPLFDTVRQVRRYANVLPLTFDLLGEEIAAIDLLALEAVRMTLPAVFEALRENATELTKRAQSSNDARYKRAAERIKAMLDKAGSHRNAIESLLRFCFPVTRAYLDNVYDSAESALKERRVASYDVLSIYFAKQLKPEQVPNSVLRAAVDALPRGRDVLAITAQVNDAQLEDFLWRVRPHLTQPRSLDEAVESILAMVELDRRIGEERHEMLALPPDFPLEGVIFDLLKTAPSPVAAAEKAADRATTLSGKFLVIDQISPKLKTGTQEDQNRLLEALATEVARAPIGKLAEERRLARLLYEARTQLSPEFKERFLEQDRAVVQLLRSSMQEHFQAGLYDTSARKSYAIPWDQLIQLFPALPTAVLRVSNNPPPMDERASRALSLALDHAKAPQQVPETPDAQTPSG